jgi:hypothetical protein
MRAVFDARLYRSLQRGKRKMQPRVDELASVLRTLNDDEIGGAQIVVGWLVTQYTRKDVSISDVAAMVGLIAEHYYHDNRKEEKF